MIIDIILLSSFVHLFSLFTFHYPTVSNLQFPSVCYRYNLLELLEIQTLIKICNFVSQEDKGRTEITGGKGTYGGRKEGKRG